VTEALPLLPPEVAVIVALPAETALTTPDDEPTVATAVLELLQLKEYPLIAAPYWSLAVAVSWRVPPRYTVVGVGATVTLVSTGQ
jgi:hypothetical protein